MTPLQFAREKCDEAKMLLQNAHEQTKRRRAALRKALAEAEEAERAEEELIENLEKAEKKLTEERERDIIRAKELENGSLGSSEFERAERLAAQEQWKRSFMMGEGPSPQTGVFKRKRGASNSPPPQTPPSASVSTRKIAQGRSGTSARSKKPAKKGNGDGKPVVDEEGSAEQVAAWAEYRKESEVYDRNLAKRRRTQEGSGMNSQAYRDFMS